MVSGIATTRSMIVGRQRDRLRMLSILIPVPNSAAITAISLTSSQIFGLSRGSSASGIPGTNEKMTAAITMRRPDAAGSREDAKRGSQ